MKRLRHVLSDGREVLAAVVRKFARGDRVHVNGEIQRDGVVVRIRNAEYTIQLDGGSRCYVYAEDLVMLAPMRVRHKDVGAK